MSDDRPKHYDAFLSYNSKDRPAVVELAERLKAERLHLYLDEWDLTPGRAFQPALAEALRDSKTCVVFLGPSGLGPWQKEEILVAIDWRVHDPSFRVIPVLLPGAERPRRGDVAHLEFLRNAPWVEFLDTLDQARAFQRLVWGVTGKNPSPEPPVDGHCPYRGLEAFRPEDERFFFGREALTGWLVSALRREVRERAQGARFLGVIGPSGSGKSSVALAGLVPKLRAGAIEGSERWPMAITRPGDDPVANLAAATVPALQAGGAPIELDAVRTLIRAIREDNDTRALDLVARSALHDRPSHVHLVVLVDQFEEVFTYRPEDPPARARFERDRAAYLANLLNAAAAPGGRVIVVITMRSDFLGTCATFPQLSAVLSAHQEMVGPMTAAELREAIVQPAYLVGHEVEPALVERLLADVKGQRGALPLLQFALTEVWKKRDVRRLTLRAYEELGKDELGRPRGIEGALEHRANDIFSRLSPADQKLCRRIFLRLVQPGEGTEDTKRRVSFRELLPANDEQADAVKNLVQVLSEQDARLITAEGANTADGWVEVAHEALIQGWTQLRQWVDADRAGLRTQRRLTEAAQEWGAASDHDKAGYLYKGAPLASCREWANEHGEELGAVESAFLEASEQAERRQQEEALEQERRMRQAAEDRRRDAEAATKRQQRLSRSFQIAAVVAGALAIAAAWLAVRADLAASAAKRNESKANVQARIADSRRIAAQAVIVRSAHPDVSLILAVEALGIADTNEARSSLFDALNARAGLRCSLHGTHGYAKTVAFRPDGEALAVGYGIPRAGGGVELWDASRQSKLAEMPLTGATGSVSSLSFSPDGKLLAGACRVDDRRMLVVWDAERRQKLVEKPPPIAAGDLMRLAFSPDGKTIAVGCIGGVALWDVDRWDWSRAGPLAARAAAVGSVAFSPDGAHLGAAFSGENDVRGVALWRMPSRERRPDLPLTIRESVIWSVVFSPDSKVLAAGYGVPNAGGGVVFWKHPSGAPLTQQPLRVSEGEVTTVAFTPDGNALAASYSGRGGVGGVVLWDAAHPERLSDRPLGAGDGYVESVAFSADGKTLAVARDGPAGAVELWGARRRLAVSEGAVTSAAFSPHDGNLLAAAYSSGVVLWDARRRVRLAGKPLTVAGDDLASLSFSPDGKTLAARYSGGLVVWDLDAHLQTVDAPLPVPEGLGRSVAFSPDGKTLAAGYDGGVLFWDVDQDTVRAAKRLTTAGCDVLSVAFSPGGGKLAAVCKRNERSVLVLWDRARLDQRTDKPLPPFAGEATSVAFRPDGTSLAVGCDAGVLLGNADDPGWTAEALLDVTEGRVNSVAFSPDGQTLAAGYTEGQRSGVVLWDAAARHRRSGAPPPPPLGPNLSNVAFRPDGTMLAVGSEVSSDVEVPWQAEDRQAAREHRGGQVVLWNLALDAYRTDARTVANRNLTREDWRRFFPDRPYHATFEDLPVPPP